MIGPSVVILNILSSSRVGSQVRTILRDQNSIFDTTPARSKELLNSKPDTNVLKPLF